MSLLLGVIAAVYFIFANPDPDRSRDEVVPAFIRKMMILWMCERYMTKIANQPEIDAAAGFAAFSSMPSDST